MKNTLIISILLICQINLYSQDDFYNYPEILENSLNGLKIISDEWISNQFICSESEKFISVKQIQDRIIAISVDESNPSFPFYLSDFGLNGDLKNKLELKDADYSIANINNLQLKDGQIHFFVSKYKKEEFIYDMSKAEYKKTIPEVINWDNVEDYRSDYFINSPSKKYQIEFRETDLIYKDLKMNRCETLISQDYDGTWSFGTGFWSEDESKFYFDNSGAVACIWELDLERKTINKIVPDHWATNPTLINDGKTMKIMYCLENCIMIVEPKQ